MVGGEGISVQGETDFVESIFVEFTINTAATFDVDEDEVVIGAVTLQDEIMRLESFCKSFGVFDNILGIGAKIGP